MSDFHPARLLERVADRVGFELIAKWRMPNLPFNRRIQMLFQHFGITSIIDIGANTGQFRDQMRSEIGFAGQIYSFEPDPLLSAALMRRAAADQAWKVFPIALGARPGMAPFNIMRNPVYNSFGTPITEGFKRGNVVLRTVEVEVSTLDAMVDRFPNLAHTFIKLDTQGFDLEIIKGGQSLVQQVPALQIEIAVKPLYHGSPSMEESIAVLRDLGFVIADMFIVTTDGNHRAVEFDCVMVRDDMCGP